MAKDLYNNTLEQKLTDPATATDTVESASMDLQDYGGGDIFFMVGESGDTLSGSLYWTLTVEESDDDSIFSSVAADDLYNDSASVVIDAAAEDDVVVRFGYKGEERYIRGVATPTGTHSSGTPIGIMGLKSFPKYPPVDRS